MPKLRAAKVLQYPIPVATFTIPETPSTVRPVHTALHLEAMITVKYGRKLLLLVLASPVC